MATPLPPNRALFTAGEIVSITGGTLAKAGAVAAAGVSTDSRTIAAGGVFVALRGEAHDGHAHVEAAAKAGAAAVIVEREVDAPDGVAVVRVGSTLAALGDLAREHLRRWKALGGRRHVVGITGSAGKTTTRVAAAALANALFPGEILASSGNLNNLVGLPAVVFGLEARHRVAILEMGTNEPGEIERLAEIAAPDVGVLTLVAAAHTLRLGTLDDIAREKGKLLRTLPPEGVAIGNADDARVRAEIVKSPAKRRALYGLALDADVRVAYRDVAGLARSRIGLDRRGRPTLEVSTPLLGEAGALACAAAIAVVEHGLGASVDERTASAAFASAQVGGGAGRLVPRTFADGLVIIDDSYNANPASMKASIRAAAEIARASEKRLVLVLGEMLELGEESIPGHEAVGVAAGEARPAEVFAIGGDARLVAERVAEAGIVGRFFSSVNEAIAPVVDAVRPGDLVLVKGSRGVATERIVSVLSDVHEAPNTLPRNRTKGGA